MWVHRVDPGLLQEIIALKSEKYIFKSVGKLLIFLYEVEKNPQYTNAFKEHYSVLLRELFGGNYTNVIKDAVLAGYVAYDRGRPPELTLEGEMVAQALLGAWELLREKQREIG